MAYVIEQWHGEQLQYWDGVERSRENRWTHDYASAVKFEDRESATKVLFYICGNVGRVTQHVYLGEKAENDEAETVAVHLRRLPGQKG